VHHGGNNAAPAAHTGKDQTVKKLILAALATAAIGAVVTPALAQPVGPPGASAYAPHDRGFGHGPPETSITEREAHISDRIEDGYRNGQLDRHEYNRLRRELQKVEDIEHYYRRTGGRLTDRERMDLQDRLDALSAHVSGERHDDEHRHS
jgi:hypothetical protein